MRGRRLLLLTLLSALSSACGAAAVHTSSNTPVELEKRTDAAETTERRQKAPHLVAPPPAYGNKVVQSAPGVGSAPQG